MLIAFVRHQIPITTAPPPCHNSCLTLVFLLFDFYNIYNIKGNKISSKMKHFLSPFVYTSQTKMICIWLTH